MMPKFGGFGTRRSLFNLKFPFKSSIRQIHMENNHKSDSRGALIVEGLSYSVESWRFPDRNTGVGQMISSYLANKSELDDHAIHLLFSANRWEKRVAFSSTRGLDIEWCKAPEMGLLAPDLVLYLDIPPERLKEEAMEGRDTSSLSFKEKLPAHIRCSMMPHGRTINACLPIKDVEKQLQEVVLDCVTTCQKGKPLSQLWSSLD
ncbi:unnamed protein product [Camellia sinensis]